MRQKGDINFQTENPQILGANVQNLVARTTWRPGFVHTCINLNFSQTRRFNLYL